MAWVQAMDSMAFRLFRSQAARRAHLAARASGRSRLFRTLQDGPPLARGAIALATLGGAGFLPGGGTMGAVAGSLACWFLHSRPGVSVLALSALTLAGVLATQVVLRVSELDDPGECVVDEVAGAWLACLASGLHGSWLLIPLVLFLLLDAVKPWPANVLEEQPGALGVMADDLAAGAWAALIARLIGLAGLG